MINGKLIRRWKNYAGELKWLPLGIHWEKRPFGSGGGAGAVFRIIQSAAAV
ncbi:MAG: hypothetical protein LBO80_02055 [Treponema sp.]|nr:hypothetical protein [Treponema sp.]